MEDEAQGRCGLSSIRAFGAGQVLKDRVNRKQLAPQVWPCLRTSPCRHALGISVAPTETFHQSPARRHDESRSHGADGSTAGTLPRTRTPSVHLTSTADGAEHTDSYRRRSSLVSALSGVARRGQTASSIALLLTSSAPPSSPLEPDLVGHVWSPDVYPFG